MLETEENDEKDTIWKLECNMDPAAAAMSYGAMKMRKER